MIYIYAHYITNGDKSGVFGRNESEILFRILGKDYKGPYACEAKAYPLSDGRWWSSHTSYSAYDDTYASLEEAVNDLIKYFTDKGYVFLNKDQIRKVNFLL